MSIQPPRPGPVSSDGHAMMMFEANKKSIVVAYLLWWFLGWAGGHRFYMSRPLSAVVMLLLSVIGGILFYIVIGVFILIPVAIWWLIDAFLIPGWIQRANSLLAEQLATRR